MSAGVAEVKLAKTLCVVLLVLGLSGLAIPSASAKTCYRIANAKSLYLRANPRKSAAVLTALKGGALVIKSGLPVCGIWWCKVTTGKYTGYVGSKYLKKDSCP